MNIILTQKDNWTRDEVVKLLHNYRLFAWNNGSTIGDLQKWIFENL